MQTARITTPADDTQYRAWLARNPDGFVLNGDRARRKDHYPMLHKASCGQISSRERANYVDASYIKVCAGRADELVSWTRSNFQREPTRCGLCRP